MVCPPGRDRVLFFFIFGFAETVSAARSALAASLVPWGCCGALTGARGQCTGAWRLGPLFKTPLIGLGMHQKQSGSVWLFSVPLAPPA